MQLDRAWFGRMFTDILTCEIIASTMRAVVMVLHYTLSQTLEIIQVTGDPNMITLPACDWSIFFLGSGNTKNRCVLYADYE